MTDSLTARDAADALELGLVLAAAAARLGDRHPARDLLRQLGDALVDSTAAEGSAETEARPRVADRA